MDGKWRMNRAGLLNFWYYDDEVFDFEDGKLLLRGSNGSGKSVTMQSFLPVLLDGKKSPDRLDPFGSRSRRMVDYLLGEKEISNRDERTGYLYIEYKKDGIEQYLTTGMGMQAKRNQPLKSWGFVITDNRRIGHDMELYKWATQDAGKAKFPRSMAELEATIGEGGRVVSSNKEYMELVNKHLFGFETIEAYEDLIKLLIQLRSPKLSKEFKPTVIYEILEEALPPLTDDDLRYLSDSIEQMDQTKQQTEQLEREVLAMKKLNDSFTQYNQCVFKDQIAEWKLAYERMLFERKNVLDFQEEISNLKIEIEELRKRKTEQTIIKKTKEDSLLRLKTHKVFKLEKELSEKFIDLKDITTHLDNSLQRLDVLKKKERHSKEKTEELEELIATTSQGLQEYLEELGFLADESVFMQHAQNSGDFSRSKEELFFFDLWKKEISLHTKKLENIGKEITARDTIKHKIQEKNKELAEIEQERDIAQNDMRKWEIMLSEEKSFLVTQIHKWAVTNDKYEISTIALQKMARIIDDLFTDTDMEQVKSLFTPFIELYENQIRDNISLAKLSLESTNEDLRILEDKQEMWETKKDPEPERHKATEEARCLLEKEGISFAPLYELVEFLPHIDSGVQLRIESMLEETGLLDALIAAEPVNLRHDRLLVADSKLLSYTLADYLQPDAGQQKVNSELVAAVLASIEMNGESLVHLTADGAYQFGALKGHAVPLSEVRFIGREARKRYREELITKIREEIREYKEKIENLTVTKDQLDNELNDSTKSLRSFPIITDVKTAYDSMKEAAFKMDKSLERIKTMSPGVEKLDRELQLQKVKLSQIVEELSIVLEAKHCDKALYASREYEKTLGEFHRKYDQYTTFRSSLNMEQETQVGWNEEYDYQKGEHSTQEVKKEILNATIKNIKEQLELAGADDIRREIQTAIRQLNEATVQLDIISDQLPRREENRDSASSKLKERMNSSRFWEQMNDSWATVVQASTEWAGAPPNTPLDVDLNELFEKNGIGRSKDKSILEGELTKRYHELQSDLIEHNMRMYTNSLDQPKWMDTISNEEWIPVVKQWSMKTTRNVIEFDQRGVKISPGALYETILDEWELQENRLDEMDKKLYEEILLNSVGNKLRGRIRRAEKWTEQMKELMESRDTSSGLKFSIRWKPRTAESEQEMDTKDLVQLLKQDPNLLSDSDMERITNHFRSKIEGAKVLIEEKGEGNTLLQVLKTVLDYRKWFSFILYFERPNEPRRELTNHKFFTFSGGEKAMAMYIPLFTACYSRYQEASPDAPYIISLDEAFAGVDENNIKEMFEILEQLDFNYIMNSQVLWGDYETVNSLAVCELVRPKNANFVTVIRYKWDGNALNVEKLDNKETELK